MFCSQMRVMCFLVSVWKMLWYDFSLFWVWYLKLKQKDTRVIDNKDSIIQASKFIKKRLQQKWFLVINAKFLGTLIFKFICKRLLLKNLSCAGILIFRRYFRSSSPSAFYKLDDLKTSAKMLRVHICRSLFSIKLQTFR